MKPVKKNLSLLWRVSYFLIPIFLIGLLSRRVAVDRLIDVVRAVDPRWLGLAVLLYPLSLGVGAIRWHRLMNWFSKNPIPLRYAMTQQWAGYAVGLFTPGYTGWDAYRIIQGSRAVGAYRSGVVILLLERMTALAASMGFLLLASMGVDRGKSPLFVWIPLGGALLLIFSLIFIGFLYWENGRLANRLIAWFKRWIFRTTDFPKETVRFRHALPVRRLMALSGWSGLIQALSILTNWLLFHAILYPLPIHTVAFVTPAALVVVLVPLSFGGMGIREFTYFYLYRPFGVAPEQAVLVSLLNIIGLLVNGGIGGVIWTIRAFEGKKREKTGSMVRKKGIVS